MILDLILAGAQHDAQVFRTTLQSCFAQHQAALGKLTRLHPSSPELQQYMRDKFSLTVSASAWSQFLDFAADHDLRHVTRAIVNFISVTSQGADAAASPPAVRQPMALTLPKDVHEVVTAVIENIVKILQQDQHHQLQHQQYAHALAHPAPMRQAPDGTFISQPPPPQPPATLAPAAVTSLRRREETLRQYLAQLARPYSAAHQSYIDATPRSTQFVPIPSLSPLAARALVADVLHRQALSRTSLPSALAVTVLNSRNLMCCAAISHNACWAALGCADNSVRLWKLGTGMGNASTGLTLDMAPPAAGAAPAAGQPVRGGPGSLPVTVEGLLNSVWPVTPGAYQAITSCLCVGVCTCRQRQYRVNSLTRAPTALSFSPCGEFLLMASRDGQVHLLQLATMQVLYRYRCHSTAALAVRWGPRGYYFVTGGLDGTARLWSTDKRDCVRVFTCGAPVTAVTMHPNGQYVAAASGSHIYVFELLNARLVRLLSGHSGMIRDLSFSPLGHLLCSVGADSKVILHDLPHDSTVFSVDGSLAYLPPGGDDMGSKHKVSLDGVDVTAAIDIAAQLQPELSAALAARTVRSTHYTQPVAVHDQICVRPRCANGAAHAGAVTSCSFSACGQFIATSGVDGTVKLWSVDPLPCDPVHTTAPPLLQQSKLLESRLMQTFYTKHTPVDLVRFTPRNLLLTLGAFKNPTSL